MVKELMSLLLCLIAIKFRRAARFVIFFQILGNIALSFVPTPSNTSLYPADKTLSYFGVYIWCVCVPEVDIWLMLISDLVIQFAILPLVYKSQALTFEVVGAKILFTLYNLIYLLGLNIVGACVVQMRGTILDLILENRTLVDQMDEGLLILSNEDETIELASKQAVCLLSERPITTNVELFSQDSKPSQKIDASNLRKPLFTP